MPLQKKSQPAHWDSSLWKSTEYDFMVSWTSRDEHLSYSMPSIAESIQANMSFVVRIFPADRLSTGLFAASSSKQHSSTEQKEAIHLTSLLSTAFKSE